MSKNKLTITLMCGAPRSGKSTWIKKHAKQDVIVSPDRIRKLIFGHQFHREAEDFIWAYAKGMAKLLLEQNKNILIDATNLNIVHRKPWYSIAKQYGAKIKIIWLNTSLKTCLKRNLKCPEDEKVPEDVLKRLFDIFVDPTNDYCYDHNIEIIEEINQRGIVKKHRSNRRR